MARHSSGTRAAERRSPPSSTPSTSTTTNAPCSKRCSRSPAKLSGQRHQLARSIPFGTASGSASSSVRPTGRRQARTGRLHRRPLAEDCACPTTSFPSASTSPTPCSTTCATGCAARAGRRPRPSTTGRRASRSRTSGRCASTGPTATTGAPPKRASTSSRSTAPTSTGSASTSSTCARRTPTRCPLVITHGWPGSIVEFHKVIGPLTDPTAHGGDAADAFHVVCPSLPGYGFSDKPTAPGWGVERIGARVGDADGPARLRPLRRAGRRLGLDGHDEHRPAGPRSRRRHPREHADRDADVRGSHRDGERRARVAGELPGSRVGLLEAAVDASRRRSGTAWSTRRRVSARGSSRSSGRGPTATAIPRTRSRDELLDNVMLYWLTATGRVVGPAVLGELQPQPPRPDRRAHGLLDLPEGDHPHLAPVGRDAIHRHPLLERARQGRPLRRLRATRPVRRRDPLLLPPRALVSPCRISHSSVHRLVYG